MSKFGGIPVKESTSKYGGIPVDVDEPKDLEPWEEPIELPGVFEGGKNVLTSFGRNFEEEVPDEVPDWAKRIPWLYGMYGAGKGLVKQAVRPMVEAAAGVGGTLIGLAEGQPYWGGALGYGAGEKIMDIAEDAYAKLGEEETPDRTVLGEIADSAKEVGTAYALGRGMELGGTAAARLEQYVFNELPERLYASAVKMPYSKKWSKVLPGEEITMREAAVREGLAEEIVPNKYGLAQVTKLEKEVVDYVDEVMKVIDDYPGTEIVVDDILEAGLQRARGTKFSIPSEAKKTIDKIAAGIKEHGETLTASEANALKRQLYKEVSWGGAEKTAIASQATELSKKGVAHELMTGLEQEFPELAALNRTDAARIALRNAIERRYGMLQGSNMLPATSKLLSLKGLKLAATEAIMGHPTVKARIAIALAKANPQKYSKFVYPDKPPGYKPPPPEVQQRLAREAREARAAGKPFRYEPEVEYTQATVPPQIDKLKGTETPIEEPWRLTLKETEDLVSSQAKEAVPGSQSPGGQGKLWPYAKAAFKMDDGEVFEGISHMTVGENMPSKYTDLNLLEDGFTFGGMFIGRPAETSVKAFHKETVKRALQEGKPVPLHVVDDYPDLKKIYLPENKVEAAKRAFDQEKATELEKRFQQQALEKARQEGKVGSPLAKPKSTAGQQSAKPLDLNRLNMMIPLDEVPKAVSKAIGAVRKGTASFGSLFRNKEIFDKTGYWLGQDGLWRYELDLQNTSLLPGFSQLGQREVWEGQLKDILYSPKLSAQFPRIGSTRITINPLMEPNSGSYYPLEGRIEIPPGNIKGLIHELQHKIQRESKQAFKGSSVMKEEHYWLTSQLQRLFDMVKNPAVRSKIEEMGREARVDNIAITNERIFRELLPIAKNEYRKGPSEMSLKEYKLVDGLITLADDMYNKGKFWDMYREVPGEMEARLASVRTRTAPSLREKYPWETLDNMLLAEGTANTATVDSIGKKLYSGIPFIPIATYLEQEASKTEDTEDTPKENTINFADLHKKYETGNLTLNQRLAYEELKRRGQL